MSGSWKIRARQNTAYPIIPDDTRRDTEIEKLLRTPIKALNRGNSIMNICRIENKELSMGIYHACIDAGFADCGIISIEDMEEYISRVRERIENVPASAGFYQNALQNIKRIKAAYPWAKSIVICFSWLGKFRYPEELQGMYAKSFSISRDSDKKGSNIRKN